MRRYAPHNTNVHTWSAAARPHQRPAPRHRALESLRAFLSAIISGAASPTSPIGAEAQPTSFPHLHTPCMPNDDVHAESRMRALRHWLGLSAPLSPAEAVALRMLMRPGARIVRSAEGPALKSEPLRCPLCAELLTPREKLASTDGDSDAPPLQQQRAVWGLNGDLLWQIVSISMFWVVYVLLAALRWVQSLRRRRQRRRVLLSAKKELENLLATSSCYSAWFSVARTLDELEGNARWKQPEGRHAGPLLGMCEACVDVWASCGNQRKRNRASRETVRRIEAVCDTGMLSAKLMELAALYKEGDVQGLAFALRASLVRNLGGMCHPELHVNSRVGTSQVVEDYVNVISYLLAYIAHSEVLPRSGLHIEQPDLQYLSEDGGSLLKGGELKNSRRRELELGTTDAERTPEKQLRADNDGRLLTVDDKLTFLNEARHAYGRSALMLSGGASMGLNHLGVVKALLEQDLLPKIVCGTSAGALVASIVGIFDDTELSNILSSEMLMNPITKQPFSFRYFDEHTTTGRRFRRFLRKGYIQDVKMLQDCLRKNYGDLTFEEAYQKTRRILNITVCPVRSSSDPPLLLNYLTAPHVLIWSAASASCALPLVFAPVELVTKNSDGRLVAYHPDGARWIDGSISSDVPLSRIGELFNVNHFIVSQTNPHVIPRSLPIMQTRIALLIKSELQFRYWQALQMGLVPTLLTSIFPHFMQPYAGDVTIMPDVRLSDLTRLLRNPTKESVTEFIRRGEIQTFPFLDRIRLHCVIEQTLDSSVEYFAKTAKRNESEHSLTSPKKDNALFGRVPSWLWLDTRSILGSSAMSAVANRLGRTGEGKAGLISTGDRGECDKRGSEAGPSEAGRKRSRRAKARAAADEQLDEILVGLEREMSTGEVVEYRFDVSSEDSDGSENTEEERAMC